MKTAILAAAKGYTPEQVKPWVDSLKSSGFIGKVFILLYEENTELADYFKEQDFHVMIAQERGETHMATQRFIDYAEVLKSDYCKDIEFAIHTDIRDVIFQGNPEEWILENIGDKHIIATGEGVTYRHEDWNGDGIERQFGKHVYLELADKETCCSGIIAGRKDMLIRLFETIYEISYYATDQNGFVDQHFYNIALRWTFDEVTKFVPADKDWVANLGTLIAIPMNTPEWSSGPRTPYSSYERIRKGSYVDNMLVNLPYMNPANQVCTPKGDPYTIVHQYDRFQPWKEKLVGKEKEVTIVTALYDLKRDTWKNFERSFDNYKEWMQNILSFDAPMVIYVDPSDVSFIERARLNKESKTQVIPMKFSDFITEIKHGEKIRSVMKSEEFLKNQSVPEHPQISFPEYNILMHEKIQFVKRAAEENKFNTDHFMWLDAGVYHMNNRYDLIGSKFPLSNKIRTDDKMHFICIEEPTEKDLDLERFYKGHNVRIIGTSWMGHREAILKFEKTYTDLINESLEKNLMDQDQSFLTVAYLRNPEICQVHNGTWEDALNLWA